MQPRLRAEIWVRAYIRRCEAGGAYATIVRRGDDDAGAVILKVNYLDGNAAILARSYNLDGDRVWRFATGPDPISESAADAYVERERQIDPDVWVVEVEDREGRHFLDNEPEA